MTKILATRKKVLKLTTSQSLLEVSSLSMGHPQTPFKAVKPDIKDPKLCVLLTKMFFLIWTALFTQERITSILYFANISYRARVHKSIALVS